MKDLSECYKLLGVDKHSTLKEVKEAYRSKARLLHPDVKGGNEAAFIACKEAYERLVEHLGKGSPSEDVETSKGVRFDSEAYKGYSYYEEMGFGKAPFVNNPFETDTIPPPFTNQLKGEDVYLSVDITYEEQVGYKVKNVVSRRVFYTRKSKCSSCRGLGHDSYTCIHCGGKGSVHDVSYSPRYGKATSSQGCSVCGGKGYIGIGSTCRYCRGNGFLETTFESDVYIDLTSVLEGGQRVLRYEGLGHEVLDPKDWGFNGDLVINLNLLKKVAEQVRKVYITFTQAIEGCNVVVELDGGKFVPTVSIPAGIRSGTKLKIDKGEEGQYLIEVLITVPKLEDLSRKAAKLFAQLKDAL